MKRAFTLIELLIVIAVMATLMGIVFRLTGIGGDRRRLAITVSRLNRVENCLSGYHAAFGCYPPVKLHGSRDIYRGIDKHGIQRESKNGSGVWSRSEAEAWEQIEAACRSQPVACRYPYPNSYKTIIEFVSNTMRERAQGDKDTYARYQQTEAMKQKLSAGFENARANRLDKNAIEWEDVQVFQFGLMSFLLPRYLVMLNGDKEFANFKQWTGNNRMPSDPYKRGKYGTGEEMDGDTGDYANTDWGALRDDAAEYSTHPTLANRKRYLKVRNIASQAICARWMPNLVGICAMNRDVKPFGYSLQGEGGDLHIENPYITVYTPNGDDSTANQYVLDCITVWDGWNREIYYYSPQPFQEYVLWSSGPNGKTFPPWVDLGELPGGNARNWAENWMKDDIKQLSH